MNYVGTFHIVKHFTLAAEVAHAHGMCACLPFAFVAFLHSFCVMQKSRPNLKTRVTRSSSKPLFFSLLTRFAKRRNGKVSLRYSRTPEVPCGPPLENHGFSVIPCGAPTGLLHWRAQPVHLYCSIRLATAVLGRTELADSFPHTRRRGGVRRCATSAEMFLH